MGEIHFIVPFTFWSCPDSQVILVIAIDCIMSLTAAKICIRARTCENVTSDLELGCEIHRVLQYPPPVTTG